MLAAALGRRLAVVQPSVAPASGRGRKRALTREEYHLTYSRAYKAELAKRIRGAGGDRSEATLAVAKEAARRAGQQACR